VFLIAGSSITVRIRFYGSTKYAPTGTGLSIPGYKPSSREEVRLGSDRGRIDAITLGYEPSCCNTGICRRMRCAIPKVQNASILADTRLAILVNRKYFVICPMLSSFNMSQFRPKLYSTMCSELLEWSR
jgi:hypothetical protein